VCGGNTPDAVLRLVSKLHSKGREMVPHAREHKDLIDLVYQFDLEPDESWGASGFDVEYIVEHSLAAMDLAAKTKPAGGIDFADMIYLPVRNRWLTPIYDMFVVDEMQDMNAAQLEIARGVCRGRFVGVGDDRQAIYAFRGADSESMHRIKDELHAKELKLTTTYRCGQRIVHEANQFVPDFVAAEANPLGNICTLMPEKLVSEATIGDFILSRLNAPLVGVAMSLLRANKRARIAGRDIGSGLKSLIRRLSKGKAANSIPEFMSRLANWEEREVLRWTNANKPEKVEQVRDQAGMLAELAAEATSVRDIETKIDALFTDDGLGTKGVITCSSVHRSKGLEADRVFVLRETLRDGNREEENIQYVAITRAINTLVWVGNKKKASVPGEGTF
jgi:superfamily I DNA/RNA helicase